MDQQFTSRYRTATVISVRSLFISAIRFKRYRPICFSSYRYDQQLPICFRSSASGDYCSLQQFTVHFSRSVSSFELLMLQCFSSLLFIQQFSSSAVYLILLICFIPNNLPQYVKNDIMHIF